MGSKDKCINSGQVCPRSRHWRVSDNALCLVAEGMHSNSRTARCILDWNLQLPVHVLHRRRLPRQPLASSFTGAQELYTISNGGYLTMSAETAFTLQIPWERRASVMQGLAAAYSDQQKKHLKRAGIQRLHIVQPA